MAIKTPNTAITVPQTSIRDGQQIHTWRTDVTGRVNSLQANSGNPSAAYAQANLALAAADEALVVGEEAFNQANAAYAAANAVAAEIPTVPGQSTQVIINQNGALGASQNLTFNILTSTLNTTAANISTEGVSQNGAQIILGVANLNFNNTASVTWVITANGTNQANIAATSSGGGPGGAYEVDTYANGSAVLANANLNWNNTATLNVSVVANGTTQANIAWSANTSAIVGPYATIANSTFGTINAAITAANTNALAAYAAANAAANTVAVFQAGTLVLAAANVNLNNTQSINLLATANGTTQVNVNATINATLNLTSLNVTSNISNTGNLLVTQNTTTGNLSVTTLANVLATLNAANYGTYANGGIVIGGIANLNFNNTATINVAITANGATQTNVALSVNVASLNAILIAVETFTATANQTAFTLSNSPASVNYVLVFRNGIEQEPTTDYTLSLPTLTMTSNCMVNDVVEVREFLAANIAAVPAASITSLPGTNNNILFNNSGSIGANAFFNVNTSTATMNVTGNLVVSNVSTFGNVNASGTANLQGNVFANHNPLTNVSTRVVTGLAAFMTANTTRTSTVALAAEANLTITVNETGVYRMDALFLFQGNVANANNASGYIVDFGGGAASISSMRWIYMGTSSQQFGSANQATRLSSTTAAAAGNVSVSAGDPDFAYMTGVVTFSGTGTFIPRYAQDSSSANTLTLIANSFVQLTKLG